jgi:hypothetical protein
MYTSVKLLAGQCVKAHKNPEIDTTVWQAFEAERVQLIAYCDRF